MTQAENTIEILRQSHNAETDGPRPLKVGAPEEIVISVNLHSSEITEAFVGSLEMLTQAFRTELKPVPAEVISTIVSLWVPKQPVSSTLLRQAKMLAKAKTEILQSNDWVTARELSSLAQFKSSNPSSQPNKWKIAGKLFALRHEGIDYFPIYGLDPVTGYRPIVGLENVVAILTPTKSGWDMAFWFASPNTFLGGKRPKDVVLQDVASVMRAAREEVSEVMHG